MNGENTKDLTENEKLDLILAEMAGVKARLSALDAIAEDRARETRPLFGSIQKDISDLRVEQANFRAEVKAEFAEVRAEQSDFRAEVKAEFSEVRGRLDKVEYRLKHVERNVGKLAVAKFDLEAAQQELEDRIIKLEDQKLEDQDRAA